MIVLTDAEYSAIVAAIGTIDRLIEADPSGIDIVAVNRRKAATDALDAAGQRSTAPDGRRLLMVLAPPVTVDLFVDLQRAVAKLYPEIGADPVGATIGSGNETTGLPIWVPA